MTEKLRKPLVELIDDENIRESLTWIYEYLISQPLPKLGFEHFERKLVAPAIEEKIAHGLGFTPKDIILTFVSPEATTVTFHYDKIDRDNIVVTTSAACTIRFLAGRYVNEF